MEVDLFEGGEKEADYLYCHTPDRRSNRGIFEQRRNGSLRAAESTAAVAARVIVSDCLDDPLHHDGDCILSGTYLRSFSL